MIPEVAEAIEEITRLFPGHAVEAEEDGQGGAYVVVGDLNIWNSYIPTSTWCGFQITFQYPRADVYPHFLDGAIRRADGRLHGPGISATSWRDKNVLQLSRRSNRWDPAVD